MHKAGTWRIQIRPPAVAPDPRPDVADEQAVRERRADGCLRLQLKKRQRGAPPAEADDDARLGVADAGVERPDVARPDASARPDDETTVIQVVVGAKQQGTGWLVFVDEPYELVKIFVGGIGLPCRALELQLKLGPVRRCPLPTIVYADDVESVKPQNLRKSQYFAAQHVPPVGVNDALSEPLRRLAGMTDEPARQPVLGHEVVFTQAGEKLLAQVRHVLPRDIQMMRKPAHDGLQRAGRKGLRPVQLVREIRPERACHHASSACTTESVRLSSTAMPDLSTVTSVKGAIQRTDLTPSTPITTWVSSERVTSCPIRSGVMSV